MERTIEQRLAAVGFTFETTGGGCSAYVRRAEDGAEELITSNVNEAVAPIALDEPSVVVAYEPHEGGVDYVDGSEEYATLGEMIAALENPSDEYHLLGLRLHNGFHRAAR